MPKLAGVLLCALIPLTCSTESAIAQQAPVPVSPPAAAGQEQTPNPALPQAAQAQQPAQAATPAKTAPPASSFTKAQQDAVLHKCQKDAKGTSALYFCQQIAYYLAPTTARQRSAGEEALRNPFTNAVPLAGAIVLNDILDTLQTQIASSVQAQAQRLDKQVGSPVSSDGSTNLVSKPGATELLSLAVESGALTQTQNGNTITLQGNLDQLTHFLIGGKQTLEYTTKGTPVLQNINASATLLTNASSTSSIPVTGSATSSAISTTSATTPSTATKLSSIGARYQLLNKYDPKTAQFRSAFKSSIGAIIVDQSGPAGTLTDIFINAQLCPSPSTSQKLEDIVNQFNDCVGDRISTAKGSTDIVTPSVALLKGAAANVQFYKNAIAAAAGVAFTLDYNYTRPTNQPDTHDVRGIFAHNLGAGIFNVNVTGSLYGAERPANSTYGRFHDFQFAGEFDRSFSASAPNAPSWSFAAYAQWQPSPSVLTLTSSSVPAGITLPANAQSFIMGTQGWLAVVQGKVVFKLGGAQIPIAAKWSNKTDLLDKGSFAGQFGISYDISQIKQLIGLGGS